MDSSQQHILIVDDDTRLRELLRKYLTENGHFVTVAANAAEARKKLEAMAVDLIVLDVMMPGEDGLSLTRWLRAQSNPVPILLLTAMGETEDRIQGFEAGADDYLPKPFEPRELLLRISSIVRRVPKIDAPVEAVLHLGRFSWHVERAQLECDGEMVHLTSAERELLAILAATVGQAVSRDDLAVRMGTTATPRAVDVQVTRLRKKLEDDTRMPRYLQTVRGVGYMLRPD